MLRAGTQTAMTPNSQDPRKLPEPETVTKDGLMGFNPGSIGSTDAAKMTLRPASAAAYASVAESVQAALAGILESEVERQRQQLQALQLLLAVARES